jgi:hypothetical protein
MRSERQRWPLPFSDGWRQSAVFALPSRREMLEGQYADLQRHPALGPLIAAEQALYRKALERAAACALMPTRALSGQ